MTPKQAALALIQSIDCIESNEDQAEAANITPEAQEARR